MLFNSYIFIFLFLPVTLIGYYLLNYYRKFDLGKLFLTFMSMWFYAYFNVKYLLILVVSILVNYILHCLLCRNKLKWLMVSGVFLNLALLGYFKYYDFFLENINQLFKTSFFLKHIALPLGISFFTFQQISFVVDTYKGETEKHNFLDYALFVCFFPQLIAGPIVTHNQMLPQFREEARKKIDLDYMVRGVQLFTYGLAKKLILADTFGAAADWGFTYAEYMDATNAILCSICYSFQLLLDFSGYCDMAKGIGFMLHIDLPTNFDAPYQSAGCREFWKRWHITLGSFFTKYVYIPMGGSRKGKLRTCVNSAVVFFLSGLWHGANWTFVIWGILHGIGYIVDYLTHDLLAKVPLFIKKIVTFCFVNFAFVSFRAENLQNMMTMYKAMFSGKFGNIGMTSFFESEIIVQPMKFLHLYSNPIAIYFPMLLYFLLTGYLVFFGKTAEKRVMAGKTKLLSAVFISVLFVYCVICLGGVNTFLYFNF